MFDKTTLWTSAAGPGTGSTPGVGTKGVPGYLVWHRKLKRQRAKGMFLDFSTAYTASGALKAPF
eukprot:2061269-Rhodomonas_salina.1